MKQFLKCFAVVCFLVEGAFAWSFKEAIENRFGDAITPYDVICSTYRTDVLDIYIVGGSTTTTATFQVFTDSAAFVTTGGLYPGTTHWKFQNVNEDTLGEAIAYWNAVPATTAGAEGGVVMALRQAAYDGNLSSSMTIRSAVTVHSSTNTTVFNTDAIIGTSYLIAATSGKSNVIAGITVRQTFASGDTIVTIYDGSATTDPILWREKITTTNVTYPLNIGQNPESYIKGTSGSAMRVDVVNTSGIPLTAGELNITGYTQ